MSIKDILVHADGTAAFESRLHYALALAQSNDAHLTALYIVPKYIVPAYVGVPMDPSVFQVSTEREWATAEAVQLRFESITKTASVNVEWRVEEGEPLRHLNNHGRYFDLVILGQTNPLDSEDFFTGIADDLVISLGRPSLVVPHAGVPDKVASRILVAWNGSHSAARAINDALPFLKAADAVEVLSINSENAGLDEGDLPAANISLHLSRHGVNATAKSCHAKGESKGDVILSQARDFGAEMLVMGAYGHSRFRELVLGGATRHLLKQMTLPVLMSH